MDEEQGSDYPWICWGDPGTEEQYLVGNRAGLVTLRDAIDRALDSGQPVEFEGEYDMMDFAGVMIASETKGPYRAEGESAWSRVFGIGCILAFLAAIASAIYGCSKFFASIR